MFLDNLSIILTERCNLNCSYCYFPNRRHPKAISEKSIKKAVDIFFCFPPSEKTILFTGGEPLLKFDLIKKITSYIRSQERKKGIVVSLNLFTNGTLLDKRKSAFLIANKIGITISIDGAKQTNDFQRQFINNTKDSCFKKVKQNLDNLKKSNLCGSIVFNKSNFCNLSDSIAVLRSLNFRQIDFRPQFKELWTGKELLKLDSIFKRIEKEYIKLFLQNEDQFKIPSFAAFLDKAYLLKRKACSKITLASDGNFYLSCAAFLSVPAVSRRKYKIGSVNSGISFEKRRLFLNKTDKIIDQCLVYKSAKEKIVQPFCPFCDYYYSLVHNTDFKKRLNSFEKVSQLYKRLFLSLENKLRKNDNFIKLYRGSK